jgi:aminocarboxymuconate-semialdehyde decarboxylase
VSPVDLHAHIVPDSLVKTLAAEAPEVAPRLRQDDGAWYLTYPSGRRSGPVPPGMFDLTSRVADMDRQGVAVQAVSVPPTHFFYDAPIDRLPLIAAMHNDAMIQVASQVPDRFRVLATLPLASPAASVEELGRLASEATVVGVELGTNVNGHNLDLPDLAAVWQAIAEAGLAVVLHPDNVAGADRMGGYYLHNFVGNPTDTTIAAASLVFGGVLSAFPALRVVLLHGGGFVPYQIGRFSHGWVVRPEPRQRLQEPPGALFERFFFDTLTHDRQALRYLINRFGPDRVCLGSDYPFDMGSDDPVGQVREATGDDPATLETILERTPAGLLQRSPAPAGGRVSA